MKHTPPVHFSSDPAELRSSSDCKDCVKMREYATKHMPTVTHAMCKKCGDASGFIEFHAKYDPMKMDSPALQCYLSIFRMGLLSAC